jgi:polyisoprenoid-binding protein YceI
MTTRSFQWTMIALIIVVILMLGGVGFVIWNQQGGQEYAAPRHNSDTWMMSGGEEESEEPPPSKEHPVPAAKEKRDSKPAEEGKTYQVDTSASRVYVKVGSATRIGHPHGVEGYLKSGNITPGAGGELVFDMKSFKADTPEARKKVGLEGKKLSDNEAKKVNEAMLGADVLNAEKFPTATYKIIAVKPAEKQDAGASGLYHVNGRFTLHGAEQPLQFKAKLERTDKEGVLRLSGSFVIKQTDYGITPYTAAGGLAKVADELEIIGELVLSSARK